MHSMCVCEHECVCECECVWKYVGAWGSHICSQFIK